MALTETDLEMIREIVDNLMNNPPAKGYFQLSDVTNEFFELHHEYDEKDRKKAYNNISHLLKQFAKDDVIEHVNKNSMTRGATGKYKRPTQKKVTEMKTKEVPLEAETTTSNDISFEMHKAALVEAEKYGYKSGYRDGYRDGLTDGTE